jgi:hypothetical protein
MPEKDIQVFVSGGAVSVNHPTVELQKNVDMARWTVTTPGLNSLTITNKADGSVIASCDVNGSSGSCTARSRTFDKEGTISYLVTVRVNGAALELDPDLIIRP